MQGRILKHCYAYFALISFANKVFDAGDIDLYKKIISLRSQYE